jgi:hypothetical protein
VRRLAAQGDLVAAAGERPLVLGGPATALTAPPGTPTAIQARVNVRRAAEYEIWLGGSLRPSAEVLVDGGPAGEVRHELNNRGQYILLGSADLSAGEHTIAVEIAGADLHPGSAGDSGALGPVALSSTEAASTSLVRVPAADAASLCGKPWDWIEVDQ